ncbi:MAG: MBL fold metallo-hydrolase, partial [Halobacteria archaeon]|nr:MBL fold metallo-hydrolase [Halobacteria archaeon]
MRVTNLTEDAETFTSNVFLALGEKNVLIDAGTMGGVTDVIREYTNELDALVLTHQHGDHVGQLDNVLDAFDVPLVCYGDHPRRARRVED